ncbi:MAG: TetR/AcrR family transcriptional regulator [Desulfuromonadales bacterium]|nr:TetR/AcrR family transcriptional regulator [Desulfuromonadales bacterium]
MAGRREKKKTVTRQAILTAAIRLFGEKGYDQTSIDDLAVSAGIGKSTVYSYFSTKNEIFLAFCDEEVDRSFRTLKELHDPQAPLLQQLVDLFMMQFRFMTDNREFGRHLLREIVFPQVSSLKSLEHDQRYLNMLEELLQQAREKGQIKADALLATASANFFMIFLGCLSGWYIGYWSNESAVRESMTRLFQQLLEGIGR